MNILQEYKMKSRRFKQKKKLFSSLHLHPGPALTQEALPDHLRLGEFSDLHEMLQRPPKAPEHHHRERRNHVQ